MTAAFDPSLESLTAWIQATDPHAAHHLKLLDETQRLRSPTVEGPAQERRRLAEKLERWRYQWLNERANVWTSEDEALSATLDLAAHELAGGPARPPRLGRRAIYDSSLHRAAIGRGMACLDRGAPLEAVTRRAAEITEEHFCQAERTGAVLTRRSMLLYAPLYLSSYCINHCIYCGFRHPNPIERKHLLPAEVLREAGILGARGFRHLLLVAGEFPSRTNRKYFVEILRLLSAEGFQCSIEIAPQPVLAYADLKSAGAWGVTLYQETYQEDLYAVYHPRGAKVSYDWRLEGLERAAEAGIGRIGLGILLGLADPLEDLLALMRHGAYLQSRFPDRTVAFSLPRIREAPAGFEAPYPVDDEMFVRMYCALRLAFPKAVLVLSTREAPELRNRLARICITQMSAGSSTVPGGYRAPDRSAADGQFPVCDQRAPGEVARWLEEQGFHVVWSLDQRGSE